MRCVTHILSLRDFFSRSDGTGCPTVAYLSLILRVLAVNRDGDGGMDACYYDWKVESKLYGFFLAYCILVPGKFWARLINSLSRSGCMSALSSLSVMQ